MRWWVDGQEIAACTIGPPPMNYGQHRRWLRYPRVGYRVVVPRREFLRCLDGFFEQLSSSEAQEAAEGLEADFPALERFRAAALPTLAQLFDEAASGGDPSLLAGLVDLFDLDVLNGLMAVPDVSGGLYHVLASLERCAVEDGQLVLEGAAYTVPTTDPTADD